MSKISYYLLCIPAIYSGFMIYKTPTLADSLIVFALCSVIGVFSYVSSKVIPEAESRKVMELKERLEIQKLETLIEHTKETAVLEKARRDNLKATMGYEPEKQIKF